MKDGMISIESGDIFHLYGRYYSYGRMRFELI